MPLSLNRIKHHFQLKQIVQTPTRRNAILDIILTNLHEYYEKPLIMPPFGLSDHNTIIASPKERAKDLISNGITFKRNINPSSKRALGRYLNSIDWPQIIPSTNDCDQLSNMFQNIVLTGVNILMPMTRSKKCPVDAPWITNHFKTLIIERQKAFSTYGPDSSSFKSLRNQVNRERKICKSNYYKLRVHQMKQTDSKEWWKEVKRLSGMASTRSSDIRNIIDIENLEQLSEQELANKINEAFLDPLSVYKLSSPLLPLELEVNNPEFLVVTEETVYSYLSKLNPAKTCGPDEISNWLLRDYAAILAFPISTILNASFKQQRLPTMWKLANVLPIPKSKTVQILEKDLRPISLTPSISKVAEECVVNRYIKPAVLKSIDSNQFGSIPNSSTTFALIDMLHHWTSMLDGTGATIRVFLFDYKKAFDFIDHSILRIKLGALDLPTSIINWIIDFLSDRYQRVKLSNSCLSEWGQVPAGVPQGTKLGPWLFLIMINDLKKHSENLWKYVDDTTASEVVLQGEHSEAQLIANEILDWSNINRMQLNADKCKEIRISFARNQPELNPITIENQIIEVVSDFKVLGLNISNNLTWNKHITELVKKASKRIYFLIQLKRAKIPIQELITFYITCIRSVLDYAVPVFHYSLPKYLSQDLERVQKRVFGIIYPHLKYEEALNLSGIEHLSTHHQNSCKKLFNAIIKDSNHSLHYLLPPRHNSIYDLRSIRPFDVPCSLQNQSV